MRAAPLARLLSTTLPEIPQTSSGVNASSSPGEIKRWPIATPGKANASMADWSIGSAVIGMRPSLRPHHRSDIGAPENTSAMRARVAGVVSAGSASIEKNPVATISLVGLGGAS